VEKIAVIILIAILIFAVINFQFASGLFLLTVIMLAILAILYERNLKRGKGEVYDFG